MHLLGVIRLQKSAAPPSPYKDRVKTDWNQNLLDRVWSDLKSRFTDINTNSKTGLVLVTCSNQLTSNIYFSLYLVRYWKRTHESHGKRGEAATASDFPVTSANILGLYIFPISSNRISTIHGNLCNIF